MSREEGFYWVKSVNDIYEVALWVNSEWFSAGRKDGRPDNHFQVVSNCLKPPHPSQPSTHDEET